MTSWTSTVWLSSLHDGSWRYQLFFWHWQVAGVIRLATRQSRCKNHQLKLKLAKPQIRRRKASRSMLFIIIFKFGYSNYSSSSTTTRRCVYQNRWLFFLSLWFTAGYKIWKSPGQKNSWNQINQFHEKTFWPNSIFCNFKTGQKSIFELGKSLKLPNMHMQFHEKIYFLFLYLISRVFLARCDMYI